ncbi:uncharacterized protein METZ01_LOCUS171353 [marine metagenome]|uniref:Uncharacterized protein n=1 Tax=marine metagenome TaxID=408172 RepID=A0A382BY12_9ZZZZ
MTIFFIDKRNFYDNNENHYQSQ